MEQNSCLKCLFSQDNFTLRIIPLSGSIAYYRQYLNNIWVIVKGQKVTVEYATEKKNEVENSSRSLFQKAEL